MHEIARVIVDASNTKTHEVEQDVTTVVVAVWCDCARRVQGTQKLDNKEIGDDDKLRDAIESARSKAMIQYTNHAEAGL